MKKVQVMVDRVVIPTYPEPMAEEMPMFAENRVHQRTSGCPYPNKVVMEVDRSHREQKEYTLVTLENEYVKIEILPEIGGRIYSALDKTTGYDYFYKQHVIKPALIGVLGSWISGGVEFNWPFHHRASGFMPCDWTLEELPDGGAACHLSDHDPIDRMKGMVSIILRPEESSFETKMRLYNRTPAARSFLWWENAAVPVNESYQIFFPPDVSYVNFHYLKSRTTYPVAAGAAYNGIPMAEQRDISFHKNTRDATSYFACASDFDFFGGYDHGRDCGVVHIGDHHISPGKKMFTWAYGQLSQSWERALTDEDGAYAELMAGSYSDNQPDFSWLAPYETKEFSQHWYPISEIGAPTYANLCCALRLDREGRQLLLQTTKAYPGATVKVFDAKKVYARTVCDLIPGQALRLACEPLPEHVTVTVTCGDETVVSYTERDYDRCRIPDVITDMPSAAGMTDPDALYLAGVHVDQYRDPHTKPDSYWKEALQRKPDHIPSLIAMAGYEWGRCCLPEAEGYARRAITAVTRYNAHPQSGEAYYVYARILEDKGETDRAYDYYYKSAWAADCAARAMTRLACLDLKRGDSQAAVRHAQTALSYGTENGLATACLAIALRETGAGDAADQTLAEWLKKDPLDQMARYLAKAPDFYPRLHADPVQTCLDIACDLAAMGRYADAARLLEGLAKARPACRRKPLYYALAYYRQLIGQEEDDCLRKAKGAPLGPCYPVRREEIAMLDAANKAGDSVAGILLGCLYYHKRQYAKAAALWENHKGHRVAQRNLAVAYYSHLNRPDEALAIMKRLTAAYPENQELLYETVVLMGKMRVSPEQRIELMSGRTITRDDLLTELAKAYNQAFMPGEAVKVLLSHSFVPCEGGEHAIADQYMFAHLVLGETERRGGRIDRALSFFRAGQQLPDSLGAGLWYHGKLVPLQYHEALCLEALGETEAAREIFRHIAGIEIEYFSNMHLKEMPYWQAKALCHLGEHARARQLIARCRREWEPIGDTRDNGFFGTTPFFIPFMDDPARLRRAQYLYLTALCCDAAGDGDAARERLAESVQLNSENLYAIFLQKFGYLS